ncbi:MULTISPECIES: hypothetical protein [unclassified Streptomyces]|uniref:hypothetical protein n=1 Tax=unclassified Streptomyces TaxID=2593676 RepID=UPI0035D68850
MRPPVPYRADQRTEGAGRGGAVGLAVHCVKDAPGDVSVARGTAFAAHLRRDGLHDALVEPGGHTFELPPPPRSTAG